MIRLQDQIGAVEATFSALALKLCDRHVTPQFVATTALSTAAQSQPDRSEALPPARPTGTFDVATLVAVAFPLRLCLLVLALFYLGLDIAEPIVLGDRGMRHPLVFVEHRIGQGITFLTHIQATIRIGIGLDIAANQTTRHLGLLQHDPLALERKRQL